MILKFLPLIGYNLLLIYYRFEYEENFYKYGLYYSWVQMLLQMGPLLHLGPVITLVPSGLYMEGLFSEFYGMRLLSVLWNGLRNDGFLKVREISFDFLFCIFSIFFIKRWYFWLKYGHFLLSSPPPPHLHCSKFYLWKTEFSLHDEYINKDFLKSQTAAIYTIRTKQRIKRCQVLFVKETRRATTKAKKKKKRRC